MSNPYHWLPRSAQTMMEKLDKKKVSGGVFIDHLTGITHTDGTYPKETSEYCRHCFRLNEGRRAVVTVNNVGYCQSCLELLS